MRIVSETKLVEYESKELGKAITKEIEDGWQVNATIPLDANKIRVGYTKDHPAEPQVESKEK